MIPALPETSVQFNAWVVCLTAFYLVVAYVAHFCRCFERYDYKLPGEHAKKLFDGVTFSGSTMVMIGVFEPTVLKLLGDTTLYLAIAALFGIGHALRSLVR